MRVLVTGAAGYIGSHAVFSLLQAGVERVIGVDSLVRGNMGAVRVLEAAGGAKFRFQTLDVRATPELTELMRAERPDAVMHFAALALVGESMAEPPTYWSANAGGTASLLMAMRAAQVQRLVFSSTAAVYGAPETVPIAETTKPGPINPYGHSKLACETMVRDEVDAAERAGRPFAAAILRYFNVAGAAADGSLGEDHRPETHLIPNVLRVALGLDPELQMLGDDYRTLDGTCVRDYVHVEDLVNAHWLMLRALRDNTCRTCNVGIGRGFSVKQVVDACAKVTGKQIPIAVRPRRPGDPPVLVSDASRIRRELSWHPRHETLDTMVSTAWEWMRRHPDGYAR